MNPETAKSSYIRDIESYFLRVTGKGLMLSSRDYSLINTWYQKSVPKDKILKAIQNALESRDASGIKGISSIKDDIEKYVMSSSGNAVKNNTGAGSLDKNIELSPVLKKLNNQIEITDDPELTRLFESAKKSVESLRYREEINLYRELKSVENSFSESLFRITGKGDQDRIMEKAEKMLPAESRIFDEESRNSSIKAFRDEIILKEKNLQNLFKLD